MRLVNKHKYANFGLGTALGYGAAAGAIGGIGYNAYKYANVPDEVKNDYDAKVQRFALNSDKFLTKYPPRLGVSLADNKTPEGRAFINSGKGFDEAIQTRQEAADLHGGRALGNIALGTAAGAGIGAGALAAWRARRGH